MPLTPTSVIWRDGEFIPWADATVHVLSHSMQFGSAVFEGVRCYSTPNGPAIFRLEDHLQRFMNSCKIYRIPVKYSIDDLVAATCELVERNKIDVCYIRPMCVRGFGAAGMVPDESPVEVYLPCWPWAAYLGGEALAKGIDACISTWNRVAPNTFPAMAKVAGNYLNSQLARLEANVNGYGEAIALGTDGMLSEGSGQNLFLVHDGTLYTSHVDGTLLPGITRLTVLALARDAGIPVVEKPLPREMIYIADEVFFSGTASEVTPIVSVDRIPIGNGKPGPITMQLQRTFLQTAGGEVDDRHGWLTYVRAERASARA